MAATAALSTPALGTGNAPAKDARTVYLVEHAHLRLVSEHGATITEHGKATGTYNAPVVAVFTIRPKSVIAHVTIYPTGGSITGNANANYKIVGNLGYFGGTFTLGRGTGKYAHVAEINHKPLGVSGVINHYNFETEVKANGEASGF
jgi:hypothetical protein